MIIVYVVFIKNETSESTFLTLLHKTVPTLKTVVLLVYVTKYYFNKLRRL